MEDKYCPDCGEFFVDCEQELEPHGEVLYWCPVCGSGAWVARSELADWAQHRACQEVWGDD